MMVPGTGDYSGVSNLRHMQRCACINAPRTDRRVSRYHQELVRICKREAILPPELSFDLETQRSI